VDVLSHLDALRNGLLEADERLSSTAADATIRSITVQCLLHIGARSFSHFLNAIERYLPVLRSLAGDGRDGKDEKDAEEKKAGRRGILAETERFWRTNGQMVGIVFDKMMQYQIVDPSDVVAYAFSAPSGASASAAEVTPAEGSQGTSINGDRWELLHAALDKANGRVVVARRKVAALRKEEEERRAKVKAKEGAMEVDAEGAKGSYPFDSSFIGQC
jgi:nuclear cap-binding protein subunit 1